MEQDLLPGRFWTGPWEQASVLDCYVEGLARMTRTSGGIATIVKYSGRSQTREFVQASRQYSAYNGLVILCCVKVHFC
jgi:hypothetical protein